MAQPEDESMIMAKTRVVVDETRTAHHLTAARMRSRMIRRRKRRRNSSILTRLSQLLPQH